MKVDEFIYIPTIEEVTERLHDKIIDRKDNDYIMIFNYISHLKKWQRVRLYYANNLITFIDNHQDIKDTFLIIMANVKNLHHASSEEEVPDKSMSVKEWNKHVDHEYFMDPNDAPENIIPDLDIFRKYIMKYVFVKYLSFDRIYRLRNFKRKVVTVIDTDSNILSMDILMNWLLNNVIKGESFGRDEEHNTFIMINTITYVISEAIKEILLEYGKLANIPEAYRPRYSMKNEFFFSLLIIGKTKKRYISKIVLREGNLMNPAKNDVKGFDFKKASTSEYAEKRFMKIIKDFIIEPKEIDTRAVLKEVYNFENEVRDSILRGERMFLPNGNAKELGAYKDPFSEQSVRAILTWNLLYPDQQIEFPAKVSLLKMNAFTEESIAPLAKTHPEIYEKLINEVFHDTKGIFVTKKVKQESVKILKKKKSNPNGWILEVPEKLRSEFRKKTIEEWNDYVKQMSDEEIVKYTNTKEEVKSKGLQVLAIPSNASIPEWAIPYMDLNNMVNVIIAPFRPILELFNNKTIAEGKTHGGVNRKTERISNIIKF